MDQSRYFLSMICWCFLMCKSLVNDSHRIPKRFFCYCESQTTSSWCSL